MVSRPYGVVVVLQYGVLRNTSLCAAETVEAMVLRISSSVVARVVGPPGKAVQGFDLEFLVPCQRLATIQP